MAFASGCSVLSILTIFAISIAQAHTSGNNNGYVFSVDLMHRDSPNSPLYNMDETHFARLRGAVRRSFDRVHRFSNDITGSASPLASSPGGAISDVTAANGEYLMNISLGTPPIQILAIADTGSDLVWTQCKPCTQCYKQDAPLFDPAKSSTYREIVCGTKTCKNAGGQSCGYDQPMFNSPAEKENLCHYSCSYGDRSYTNGDIAVDSLTLDSVSSRPVVIKNAMFGCGTSNGGTFSPQGSGIIGLGGGTPSLVSQMGPLINGAFSYCLIPLSSSDSSSKINFGAVVSGKDVVTTGLIVKEPKTFYYLTLEAITIGTERIKYDEEPSLASLEGNIIIDSGTTLTILPQQFYSRLEASVIKQIGKDHARARDQDLSLCYNIEKDVKFPEVTVHFAGGDVKLNPYNAFVRVSDTVICFAFASSGHGFGIYGNLAQMNFLVGYDSQQLTVSFKPVDCTAL